MQILSDNRFRLVAGFILAGAFIRLLPHPFNFTPIAAMALFGGVYLKDKKLAFLLPMTALLLSDLFLEMYDGNGLHPTMLFVYGSMAISTMMGFQVRGREQRATIMVASLMGSIVFFFVTNFGVWLVQNLYPMTLAGLRECYVQAIPFFRGTIIGDLFYNFIFFGGFALIRRFVPAFAEKRG